MNRCCLFFALTGFGSLSLAQDPWPMERYDRWGTNRAPVGPTEPTKGWLLTIVGNNVVSNGPALAANGIGYYGTWQSGSIHKFDPSNGVTLGTFAALSFVDSSTALAGNQLYAAANNAYAIDLGNFDYNWFFAAGQNSVADFYNSSPMVGPDLDMVLLSGGSLFRANRTTGAFVWQRTGLGETTQTVAFSRDDTAVFGSHGNRITAFRYSDGTNIWTRDLGTTMGSPGVAQDGTVIVGSASGVVYALNPTNGSTLWTRPLLASCRTAPAFGPDGTIYVTSADTRLYALRPSDGVRLWSYISSGQALAAPAVGHDGMVYFCNRNGDLYKVSPLGVLQWQLRLVGESRGPMSIGADGTLYVPTWGNSGGLAIVKQLPAVVYPDSFQYADGSVISGSMADLMESDDLYFQSISGEIQQSVNVNLLGVSPIKSPSRINLELEARAERPGLTFHVALLKYPSTFITLGGFVAPTVDTSYSFALETGPSQWVRQSDGQMTVRLKWAPINDEDPAQDGWATNVDLACWTVRA